MQSNPPWVSALWIRRPLWTGSVSSEFTPASCSSIIRFLGSSITGQGFRSQSSVSHLVYRRELGLQQACSLPSHSLGRSHPQCVGGSGPWRPDSSLRSSIYTQLCCDIRVKRTRMQRTCSITKKQWATRCRCLLAD